VAADWLPVRSRLVPKQARWVCSVPTPAPTRSRAAEPVAGERCRPGGVVGAWLFADWLDLPTESTDLAAVAAVELQASMRYPYRQLSRVFHFLGQCN